MNISQRELAAGIGVSAMTVGKYEKGKPVRSRKMLRQSGIGVMELTQLKREKELNEIKEKRIEGIISEAWLTPSYFFSI